MVQIDLYVAGVTQTFPIEIEFLALYWTAFSDAARNMHSSEDLDCFMVR